MKETWKDYIAPGILASGLLMLLIGVAVFGSPANERQINHSHITTDDFTPMLLSTDETIEEIETQDVFGFGIEFESESLFAETNSEEIVPLEKPAIEDLLAFDQWNNRYFALLIPRIINKTEIDVETLVSQTTKITEEDGAIYYYAVGYLNDQLMRRTFADGRPAESLDTYYQAAVQNYDKAIERIDNNALFYHFRGQVDYHNAMMTKQLDNISKAVPYYIKAAELAPHWVKPVALQGWCALEQGKYREAITLFEQAEKIDAECWDVKSGLPQAKARLAIMSDFINHDRPLDFSGETVLPQINRPTTTESHELDRWNDAFRDIVERLPVPNPPDEIPNLATQLTGLTESDGSLYYYVVGYLYDRFSRNSETFRKTNYTRAVENYTKAIEQDDSVAVFYHFRGQVNYFYALNENKPEFYEKAIEDYNAATKCDPNWAMPPNMHGWALFQLQKYDEAAEQFERAVAIDEKCIDAMKGYAETIYNICDQSTNAKSINAESIQKALDFIKKWHDLVRDDPDNRVRVGFFDNSQIEKLITHLKYRFKRIDELTNPEYFSKHDVFRAMNDAYEQKRYDDAMRLSEIIVLEEHRNVYSNLSDSVQNFLQSRPDYYLIRSQCHYGIKEYENAIEDLKIFEEKTKQNSYWRDSYGDTAACYYILSLFYLEQYDEAVEYYQSKQLNASRLKKDYAYVALGLAFHRLGKDREMLESMDKYSVNGVPLENIIDYHKDKKVAEDFCMAYFNAYIESIKQAFSNGEPVDKTKVSHFTYHVNSMTDNADYCRWLVPLGDLHVALESYDKAVQCYTQYLDIEPQDIPATEKLMRLQERQNRWSEAIRVATKLIAMDPENPNRWIDRTRLEGKYSDDDRPRLSIGDLTRAMKLLGVEKSQQMATLHFWRGEQYAKAYRHKEAIADWKTAMEMTSDKQSFESIAGDKTLNVVELLLDHYRRVSPNTDDGRTEFFLDAVDFCTKAIEKGHDEQLVLVTRADAYQRLGQYQKAIDDYMVLVTFGLPKDSTLTLDQCCYEISRCYQLGTFPDLIWQKQLEKAKEFATLAIEHAKEPQVGFYAHRYSLYRQLLEFELTDEQRKEYEEQMSQDHDKASELGHDWSW